MRGVLHHDLTGVSRAARDGVDLLTDRQQGVRAWTLEHARSAAAGGELAYALEQVEIEHWLEQEADRRRDLLLPPSLVVAHRSEWLRSLLRNALLDLGVRPLAEVADSAGAIAPIVVGQPQLLVVSEHLADGSGLALVRRTRALSPGTIVLVEVEAGGNTASAVAAGAHVVLSRAASLQDLVDLVLQLLLPGAVDRAQGLPQDQRLAASAS